MVVFLKTLATENAGRLSCRSPRQVYKEKKQHTQPPVSLLGQLLWREFYYAAAAHTPNYHQKEGNPICKQIDWDDNAEFFKVWSSGPLPPGCSHMLVLCVACPLEALKQSQGYLSVGKRQGVTHMEQARYGSIRLAAGVGGVQDRVSMD